jgi:hypothetical protein
MKKYKPILKNKKNEQLKYDIRQKYLKEKNGIEDENVIVIERNNMTKYILNLIIALLKKMCIIMLLILAFTGFTAVVYPEPREALYSIVVEIQQQLIILTER